MEAEFTVYPFQDSRLYAKVDTNGFSDQDWALVIRTGKTTHVMRVLYFLFF